MSRSGYRATFDEQARRWRQEFLDRYSENGERKDLDSRWQQYSGGAQPMFRATRTEVDNPERKHTGTKGHHVTRQLWP